MPKISKALGKAKQSTLTNGQHTKLGEYASEQRPQQRDPGSEYMDDIIESIDQLVGRRRVSPLP